MTTENLQNPRLRRLSWGDGVMMLTLVAAIALGIHLAHQAPAVVSDKRKTVWTSA